MPHKIVLVSHVIRGLRYSEQRVADIAATRRFLRMFERRHRDIIFTAPYLLYADTTNDIARARIALAGWFHNPPDELWVVGSGICDGMRAEIDHMRKRGLPAFFETHNLGRRAQLPSKAVFLMAAE